MRNGRIVNKSRNKTENHTTKQPFAAALVGDQAKGVASDDEDDDGSTLE